MTAAALTPPNRRRRAQSGSLLESGGGTVLPTYSALLSPENSWLTAHCVQDWDLKMEKGHCLNYLGDDTFDVSFPPPSNSTAPKSVKRVHQIFEKPTFLESVSSAEVIQGSLGNCWAVAALSALADVEDGIKRLCVEYDTREYLVQE